MAGGERSCSIFGWGHEMKKVRNHWFSGLANTRVTNLVVVKSEHQVFMNYS